MTDIFFSYSSADRERVRPIREHEPQGCLGERTEQGEGQEKEKCQLVTQGFEVFWDQQVPAGMDWDTWIRQHLTKSKCAMAFWSATSARRQIQDCAENRAPRHPRGRRRQEPRPRQDGRQPDRPRL
jgi:hypothetical protein